MSTTKDRDDGDAAKDSITGLQPENESIQHSEKAMPAELISAGSQHLHRSLGGKEIQLLAVGGAIGTCMYGSDLSVQC